MKNEIRDSGESALHHPRPVVPPPRSEFPDWRDCSIPSYPPFSSAEERRLIERAEEGGEGLLFVTMGAGSGTSRLDKSTDCVALTPSLGICQAVLIASRTSEGAGRVSLTHFCPADHEAHASALQGLVAQHAREGYTKHVVCYAFPRDDYAGRYRAPICCQAELREFLGIQTRALPHAEEQTLFYRHIPYDEAGRSALIAHTFSHQGDRALIVDLFGAAPLRIW